MLCVAEIHQLKDGAVRPGMRVEGRIDKWLFPA